MTTAKAQVSSSSFKMLDFEYFEQARSLRSSTQSHDAVFMALRERAKELQKNLQQIGETLRIALQPIRGDLEWNVPPLPSGRIPLYLMLTLSRTQSTPQTDAQLYLLLREEGIELGFGFGLRETQARRPVREQFQRTMQRHHRKASSYLKALVQRDYRLWSAPHQTFQTPSMTHEEWKQNGSAIVRLLDRGMLLPLEGRLTGVLAQICSELIGLYGFIDRTYTKIPTLRPLHIESPEDIEHVPLESDIHSLQSIGRECIVDFLMHARQQQLFFPPELVRTYILSLQTRPIVILSGTAGTGKSKLATVFAQFMTQGAETLEGNPHLVFVPVRPDWLDPQALLGYYDTLSHTYRPTPFLQLLLRAQNDPQNPYFVILDEMNLARIEYYFSDVLSLLESRTFDERGDVREQAPLICHTEPESLCIMDPFLGPLSLPAQLTIPTNVYFTGTVNMDETTHRLSPKVLDRSNLIEVPAVSPALYLEWFCQAPSEESTRSPAQIAQQRSAFTRHGRFTAPYRSSQLTLSPERIATLAAVLDSIHTLLQQAGFSLSLRTIQEIIDFSENCERLYSPKSAPQAWILDVQMMQKILPRLHGSRPKLEPLLQRLLRLCWPEREQPTTRKNIVQGKHIDLKQAELYMQRALGNSNELDAPDLPQSARKIARMLTELQTSTYVDFHRMR